MGTELSYLEETEEEARVGSLLNRLVSGFEERCVNEEPWCAETEPGWVEGCDAENSANLQAPKTWQVLNSNSGHNSAWDSHGDGTKIAPVFRPNPKLVPGVGQDQFRSTAEMEANWHVALSEDASFATATPEKMGSALDDLVSSRLGGSLQECIDVLEAALDQSADRIVELPPGAAIVDVLWELHGELEWNSSFKLAMREYLNLSESSSQEVLLETLVARLITCIQKSRRLRWLQQKFQLLVGRALDEELEIEACEREQDDPFAKLLVRLKVSVPQSCHQDIICQSLDAIGC